MRARLRAALPRRSLRSRGRWVAQLAKSLPKHVALAGAHVERLVSCDATHTIGDGRHTSLWLGHFPEAEVRSFLLTAPADLSGTDLSSAAWNGAHEAGWKVFILLPVGAG